MPENRRLLSATQLIRNHLALNNAETYCAKTGVTKESFVPIEPKDFDGQIYAIDGSNIVVCNWSVANLNQIRTGYVVYKGRAWQKTVFTYDDAFWADPKNYETIFDPFFQEFFGLEGISLEESDLDRLSSYFRELQEYIALADAIDQSQPGDLILYDGGFDVFKPLRDVLRQVLKFAEDKDVDLLGISKSSSLSWGEGVSRPFVKHTSSVGSQFCPESHGILI